MGPQLHSLELELLALEIEACERAHKGREGFREHLLTEDNVQLTVTHPDVTSELMRIRIGGSRELRDWLGNLDLKLVSFLPDMFGSVHQGFKKDSESALRALRTCLSQSVGISISGHSLGAATAMLLACKLYYLGYDVKDLTLFACPRLSDDEFVEEFAELPINTLHVYDPWDIVPYTPPFFGYCSLGVPVLKLEGSSVWSLISPWRTHYHSSYAKKLRRMKSQS